MTRALAIALGLLSLTAAGQSPLDNWFEARAREHEAYARTTQDGGDPHRLYRERPPEASFPDFVPPTSLAPLIKSIRSGVVNISTVNVGSVEFEPVARRSLGSGFILSPDGFVVTNNHVVAQARQIRVTLADGRHFLAEVVGRDPSTDVALLQLVGNDVRDLPFTYLGDSDRLEVGDWVLAIGNPFGLDHSVSHGMISAKERVLGIGMFDDFIQTDALINPGNSGGPLFNMRGEVVGVNTAIVSQGQGIGFAVPSNMVKDLLPNLRINGRLARGWLGVNIKEGANGGAVVSEVFAKSPASEAGIRAGDRVLSVNGRPIGTYLQLLRRVSILAPGSDARLMLQRDEQQFEVLVHLGERPAPEALQAALTGPGHAERLGLVVQEITGPLAAKLNLAPFSGVLVTGVVPGTASERAGLREGDLITEVNKRRVNDLRAFRQALAVTGPEKSALVRVQRGQEVRVVAVGPG